MKKTLKEFLAKGKKIQKGSSIWFWSYEHSTFGHEKLIQKVESIDEELKVMVSSM